MLKVLGWNIAHRQDIWRAIVKEDLDVALRQEAVPPPDDVASQVEIDDNPWRTKGVGLDRPWRTAVAALGSRVQLQRIPPGHRDYATRSRRASRTACAYAAGITSWATPAPNCLMRPLMSSSPTAGGPGHCLAGTRPSDRRRDHPALRA